MPPLDLKNKRIVLLLQGGGTLGSYQVGAFRALAERCLPEWVAGISIGAVNSAIIARHRGPDPVAELESFWDDILSPGYPPADPTQWMQPLRAVSAFSWLQALEPRYAGCLWSTFNPMGQAGFYTSRVLNPYTNPFLRQWVSPMKREELSFYDTGPLCKTLEKHADFRASAKQRPTRLSVGACRVADGEVVFFDTATGEVGAQHVLASGALPPAFPPIEIEDEWYFDGGISSNTSIELLRSEFNDADGHDTLVILADLWDRKTDTMPRSMDELLWRQKSIQFGSRKVAAERVVQQHQLEAELNPRSRTRLEVCEVMRESRNPEEQFAFSDADFLRGTYDKLRRQGYEDMTMALDRPEPVPGLGGKYATLYRYGSAHKHRSTDSRVAVGMAMRR